MARQNIVCILLATSAVNLGLVGVGGARAEPPSTQVQGDVRVDADVIRSYFHSGTGGELDAAAINTALETLYATNFFSDVQIVRSSTGVRIKVSENPIIARIAFEGNKAINDKQLKSLIGSKENGPLSRPLVQADIQNILAAYHRHGRLNVQITPQTIRKKSGVVDLIFAIAEGERTGIRAIQFIGNGAFAASQLKTIIKSGETNWLSFILENDFYDQEKAEADCASLQYFYRTHGYPDAQVTVSMPQYDARKNGLLLTFHVNEGALYRIGDVAVTTVHPTEAAMLKKLVETHNGDRFNADAIDRTVNAMLMALARRGDPFIAVNPRAQRRADHHTIDLTYEITPGPRVYVERIEIHGNKKTRDDVIRREITLGEGSPYNRALAGLSERHLKQLGFFKTVKFTQKPGSAPDRVVLDVDVQEDDTGVFTIAGGYSDTNGAIASVSVGDRNAVGSGDSVKLSVDYGQYMKGFNAEFSESYPFGQHLPVGINLFAKQSDANTNQAYTSTVYGGQVSVTTPLSDHLGLQWRYGLSNQSLALDPSLGTASLPVQQAAAAGPMWVSSVGSTVTYSTLDDPRHPTQGFQAQINNDVAGLGGDVKFLRNTDDLKYYQPVAADITGLSRAQTGYITPWGSQNLPLLNGFFGGPQLVRGFAPNGFGPRDITPGTTMDNLGGNAYWALSQEFQAPVPMMPSEFQLKAAIFADAGSLWGTGASNYGPALSQSLVSNSQAIRSSVGAGLIWDSILGPLRVDYAYPLTKGPYDITQRLHFGFGAF